MGYVAVGPKQNCYPGKTSEMAGMADPCPKVGVCRSMFIITISAAPLPAVLDTLVAFFFGGGGSGWFCFLVCWFVVWVFFFFPSSFCRLLA